MAVKTPAELSFAAAKGVLSDRLAAGLPSIVFDAGFRSSPQQIPYLDQVPNEAVDEVALLDLANDDDRWHSLMALAPETLAEDLDDLARLLCLWRGVDVGSVDRLRLEQYVGEMENSLSLQHFFSYVCYDANRSAAAAITKKGGAKEGVAVWRSFLQTPLGEWPTVFQDPWFGRLFLGGGNPFPLSKGLIFANLQAPRTPVEVAARVAAVVASRALATYTRRDGTTDLAFFIADSSAVGAAVEAAIGSFLRRRRQSLIGKLDVTQVRFRSPVEVSKDAPGKLASAIIELTRVMHSVDGDHADHAIYRQLPSGVDHLHRPDYLKGVAYGFEPFCRAGAGHLETVRALAAEGIALGATGPLWELPEEL